MRCFLALDLPSEVRAALARWQAELKSMGLEASFTRPEQMHVTLCFFGEIPASEADRLGNVLASFSRPSFDAEVSGVGFFPSERRVDVVWAGFGQGRQELIGLQAAVATHVRHADAKPFHPHVTLARVKRKPDLAALRVWAEKHSDAALGHFRAETLNLYESVLETAGPAYRALATVRLH